MVDSWFNWLSSLQSFCPPFSLLVFCNCLPSLSSTLILTDWTVKLPKKWSTTLCRSHLCVCLSSRGLKAEVNLRRCEPHTHRLLPLHLRFTPGTFPCVSSVYFAWGISAGGSQERERERGTPTAHERQTRRLEGDEVTPHPLDIYSLSKLSDDWSPLTSACTHVCARCHSDTALCKWTHPHSWILSEPRHKFTGGNLQERFDAANRDVTRRSRRSDHKRDFNSNSIDSKT